MYDFFEPEDFRVFIKKNENKQDDEIQKKRNSVQNKLMKLHNMIYRSTNPSTDIHELGLYCNGDKTTTVKKLNDIVSKQYDWFILETENRYVYLPWLFIRYGSPKDTLERVYGKEYSSLRYHANLQFGLFEPDSCGVCNFSIGLYLGKNDNYDRKYIISQLENNPSKCAEIETVITKFSNDIKNKWNSDICWTFFGETSDENECFYFLDKTKNQYNSFCEFFIKNKNVRKNTESFIEFVYSEDDERLLSSNGICKELVEKITLLLPLYKAMKKPV